MTVGGPTVSTGPEIIIPRRLFANEVTVAEIIPGGDARLGSADRA